MRLPQRPPLFDFNSVLAVPNALNELRRVDPLFRGRYIHWDKLRRLTPPVGITHEQWWGLIKIQRLPLLKTFPLSDSRGKPFRYAATDTAVELLHGLDKDAAGQIQIGSDIVNSNQRDRFIVSSLMEEAITSSQIEGAATTRVVAKEMLRSKRPPRDDSERMIANNYAALGLIRARAGERLTRDRLMELHRTLTDGTLRDPTMAGRLRCADEAELVAVYDNDNQLLHQPPPADQLDSRLDALIAFVNGETPNSFIHPVIRAIAAHFCLAYDHPFVDGNGRCARGLFYWTMLANGYWMTQFLSISQIIQRAHARYGRAFLYTETDENDLTSFVLYHLDLIRHAIDGIKRHLARKADEAKRVADTFRGSRQFNHRQAALLHYAIRHDDAIYTFRSHQSSHGIVYQTARTDLVGLADQKLLDQSLRGQTIEFRPAKDLAKRLQKRK